MKLAIKSRDYSRKLKNCISKRIHKQNRKQNVKDTSFKTRTNLKDLPTRLKLYRKAKETIRLPDISESFISCDYSENNISINKTIVDLTDSPTTNNAQHSLNDSNLISDNKTSTPNKSDQNASNTMSNEIKSSKLFFPNIEKLSQGNYSVWAISLESALTLNQIWLDPNKLVATLIEKEKETNKLAGLYLIHYLDEHNIKALPNYRCFISSWNKLKQLHTDSKQNSIADVFNVMMNLRPENDINTHLRNFETQFARLQDMSEPLSEKHKVAFILGSLVNNQEYSEVARTAVWHNVAEMKVSDLSKVLTSLPKYREPSSSNTTAMHTNEKNKFDVQSRLGPPNHKYKIKNKSTRDFNCPPCRMDNHTFNNCWKHNRAVQRPQRKRQFANIINNDESDQLVEANALSAISCDKSVIMPHDNICLASRKNNFWSKRKFNIHLNHSQSNTSQAKTNESTQNKHQQKLNAISSLMNSKNLNYNENFNTMHANISCKISACSNYENLTRNKTLEFNNASLKEI